MFYGEGGREERRERRRERGRKGEPWTNFTGGSTSQIPTGATQNKSMSDPLEDMGEGHTWQQ